MNMLYVLIPLALMLLAVAAWALIWAIRSGQFDDLDSQAWSVVLDEDKIAPADDPDRPKKKPEIENKDLP